MGMKLSYSDVMTLAMGKYGLSYEDAQDAADLACPEYRLSSEQNAINKIERIGKR
jgi:hypothetical protein